ncbi:ATPase component of an ABC polysaccharide exporter [Bordetella ansorpii]|uniref:ATPase component of an ABC polysaccharide exporter n=1 Tax=Bordetella ansorpii TaxID=288768 RepID=A0A157S6K9_9BORD|nr:ATPase [Bordetella ansorpii]SAI65901.1 ATPase component of an ABC polysaccharide exporter [Bordetella ansorpii]
MIHLNRVTDEPFTFGSRQQLLTDVTLDIPVGRYALLSPTPELHRQVVDVLCGLRPPRQGFVRHGGSISWAIGRQGFVRGKANGLSMIQLVCERYEIDADAAAELVADLISEPQSLTQPMEHWPLYVRQEFSFALALAPAFDIYVIEGSMPFEPCRFTRLWLALFEERLVGRTLVFSSYRQNQLADYCYRGLIYERSALRIEEDLDRCISQFPPRRSRAESGGAGEEAFGGGLDDVGF